MTDNPYSSPNVTSEVTQKTYKFKQTILPALLHIASAIGILSGIVTFIGVGMAYFIPKYRQGFYVKDDLMLILFLSELIFVIPYSIWAFTRVWFKIEIDNKSKFINRFAQGFTLMAFALFFAANARNISSIFQLRYDREFLGCAILYMAGGFALFPFLKKYKATKLDSGYNITEFDQSFRKSSFVYLGLIILGISLTVGSIAITIMIEQARFNSTRF